MSIKTCSFGKTSKGEETTLYTIDNSNGIKAGVTDFGAILVSLFVPDRDGHCEDVVLGFDSVSGYEKNPSFLGSTIGRNANRVANARFTLNGVTYKLAVNDGVNNLHSEFNTCFNKKLFKGEILDKENGVRFTVFSPDGDQGFPGNMTATVTYRLTEDNALEIEYGAVCDADTIYNPTNHSYFNLAGHASGSAMGHKLMLKAAEYTPTFPGSIPTGEIAPVAGTPFDFTEARVIGDRIDEDHPQLKLAGGYDHNFVNGISGDSVELIAELSEETSGRHMRVYTDLPGVQFYAGNFISTQTGKGGVTYTKRCAVCLETQYFPNACNEPKFASPVLRKGEQFKSITRYVF